LSATTDNPSIASPRIADAPGKARLRRGALLERLIPLGAILAAAATGVMRPATTDVSWLLTVNDRILAGATPYKDVVELNPPASILLYRIPVLVANLLGLRSEIAVVGLLALLIGGVVAYAGRTLTRYDLGAAANRGLFLAVATLVLAVLPFDEMAQREHFATIFALPYAFIAIARVADKRIALADALFVGALMGLCIAIKPHFALCAIFVSSFDAWRSRKLRALVRIENGAAAIVVLAYFFGGLVFFPKFFSDVLPMVADLYLPIRLGAGELISHIAFPIIMPLSICWFFRDERDGGGTLVFLLTAAGFLGAYFVQGKGWSYHAYPVIAFCLFAAAWTLQQAKYETGRLSPRLGALALAAALVLPSPSFFRRDEQHAVLAAAISKLAPHPRILALAFRQSLGHPLARNIGVWVGRSWGLWATGDAVLMKERVGDDPFMRAKADAYFEKDRLAAAEDIETQRPDMVLIQETPGFDFTQWITESPRLLAALSNYRLVETVDGVEILQRRPGVAGTG
jgi:hypothetical protein